MNTYWGQMLQLAVPAALVFSCFYFYRKRALDAQHLVSGPLRETGLILFVMSLFGVLSVTLRPIYSFQETDGLWGNLILYTERLDSHQNVNLDPFRMFELYYYTLKNGDYFFTITNLLGNLAVFVPIGLFPALLFRKESWFRSAGIGFILSFLIECGQYFLGRATDVDDIILNTLGAVFGYWLFLLLQSLFPGFTAKFRCHRK